MANNTPDPHKTSVLASLETVRAALRREPPSPSVTQALEQCDRLQLAISQFHAEGLRFAAFTLLRMVQSSGSVLTEPVQQATRDLKAALEAAHYPH